MEKAENTQPAILLVSAKWWPLAARMGGALCRQGCRVSVLCPPRHPLTFVAGITEVHKYSRTQSLEALRRAVRISRPDLIVPCDDGVVTQLHALHRSDPEFRPLIEHSLGRAHGYEVVESRFELLQAAAEMGIRVPRTVSVTGDEVLVRWHVDPSCKAVLKLDGECGGNGVRISGSLAESRRAFRQFRESRSRAFAWKRALIDLDPLALWQRTAASGRGITAQEFIEGRPANAMMVCWQGELLAIVCVAVVSAEGQTGAATVVRRIRNEEMRSAGKLLAARLGLSGFYGLDFLLESGSGRAFLIEMNPRCTQLGHMEFTDQCSLAAVLAARLRGEPSPRAQSPITRELLAFYPQAMNAGDAVRPFIAASHHDVPYDDPGLQAELALGSWPSRHLLSRLYHALRRVKRGDPMLFEKLEVVASPPVDLRRAAR